MIMQTTIMAHTILLTYFTVSIRTHDRRLRGSPRSLSEVGGKNMGSDLYKNSDESKGGRYIYND